MANSPRAAKACGLTHLSIVLLHKIKRRHGTKSLRYSPIFSFSAMSDTTFNATIKASFSSDSSAFLIYGPICDKSICPYLPLASPLSAKSPFSVTLPACLNIAMITVMMLGTSGSWTMWPTLIKMVCRRPQRRDYFCSTDFRSLEFVVCSSIWRVGVSIKFMITWFESVQQY